jgi:hypothetical protein
MILVSECALGDQKSWVERVGFFWGGDTDTAFFYCHDSPGRNSFMASKMPGPDGNLQAVDLTQLPSFDGPTSSHPIPHINEAHVLSNRERPFGDTGYTIGERPAICRCARGAAIWTKRAVRLCHQPESDCSKVMIERVGHPNARSLHDRKARRIHGRQLMQVGASKVVPGLRQVP